MRSAPAALARVARSPPATTATLTSLLVGVGSSRFSLILDSGFLKSISLSLTASSMLWLNFRFSVLALTSVSAFVRFSFGTGTFGALLFSFQLAIICAGVELLHELFWFFGGDGDPHADTCSCDLFDCRFQGLGVAVRSFHLGNLDEALG